MLFDCRLFPIVVILYSARVNCAPRRFDNNFVKTGDSQRASNAIELEQLDPRNQAVHSSYSIVETTGGSSGPNRIRYTKSEYEPSGENSEDQPVSGRKRNFAPERLRNAASERVRDASPERRRKIEQDESEETQVG